MMKDSFRCEEGESAEKGREGGRKGGREGGREGGWMGRRAGEPKGNVEEGTEAVDEVESEEFELEGGFVFFWGPMAFAVVEEDDQIAVARLQGKAGGRAGRRSP
jgi:hypothetical protein